LVPNLAFGNFAGKDFDSADLSGANLYSATLSGATLRNATLQSANLSQARLEDANLEAALLSYSNLSGANLTRAVLRDADLEGADLSDANLNEADLARARITKCWVYGVSVWNAQLEDVLQSDLLLSRNRTEKQGAITVDSIEMAVVVNLLASGGGIRVREFIDVLTSKIVLILGRFTPDRKAVLNAIQEELRRRNYVPIVFDFIGLRHRDFTEAINTLAGMCLFIIADITNPKSSPIELQATIPNYMVPFVPIIQEGEQPFAMFEDLRGKFDWVLDLLTYNSASYLIRGLKKAVIQPALKKHDELLAKKSEQLRIRHMTDYLADI
jgi:Pentapeptide repeats (8 copies)